MAELEVFQFGCRSDNFGVLVHDRDIGVTAAIDAPQESAINEALDEKGWTLSHILVTHHHYDHVEGIEGLKKKWGAIVIANRADAHRIPGVDMEVDTGSSFDFASYRIDVIDTPGHTVGHVALHIPAQKLLFTGDTMFSMGCGRLFEGTAEQMWSSLDTLRSLPGDTNIYCGHEYTKANAAFALSVDDDNETLKKRAREVDELRAAGQPTLPVSMALERATNPFLRPDDPAIRARLGMADAENVDVFAELRRRKDRF